MKEALRFLGVVACFLIWAVFLHMIAELVQW